MHVTLKAGLAGAALCLVTTAAGAQDARLRTRLDTAVTLAAQGTVDVSLMAGRVNIIGGTGSAVRVRAVSDGDHVEFDATASRVRLRVEHGGGRDRRGARKRHGGGAEFDLTVPVGTLVVVETISAPVSVRGVKGEVKVETVSGSIVVNDAIRTVTVESVSGNLEVSRVAGDVRAETVSGQLGLNGVTGDIVGETVSGRIDIAGARSKSVRAESVSGQVSYSGTFDPAGTYSLTSHSGALTLRLPASAGATIRLETFSGSVDSDFPLTLGANGGRASHDTRFEFTIGNGRSRITAETFSGNIRILRGTTRDQPQ